MSQTTQERNKALVLDREPVASRLRQPGTVAMRADWTKPDPLVTAYLASFGRYGVPFNAVYGPGAPQGIPLPDAVVNTLLFAGGAALLGTVIAGFAKHH